MVLNSVVENTFNQQINAELYASYLYLSMSAWLEHADLPGFARFMRGQSQEEYEHAMRFLKHIEDRDGFVRLLPIEAPPTEFDSVEDVIAQALAHEAHVSVLINDIYRIAVENEDHAAQVMLHWFITEQVEEEKLFRDILAELRKVADQNTRGLPTLLIDDVGSGCLLDTRQFGLAPEPRPQDSIEAGADLVLFSGDKLLGGPQAGLIIGKQAAVNRLRSHPLMRVLRLDKAAIAGLSATLQHYLLDEAVETVPIWRMIAANPEQLRERAETWRSSVDAGDVEPAESAIGGGSLPAETRPTFVWTLPHPHPTDAARQLRERTVPIIARVEHDRLILDPRTVLPGEDAEVIAALQQLLGNNA